MNDPAPSTSEELGESDLISPSNTVVGPLSSKSEQQHSQQQHQQQTQQGQQDLSPWRPAAVMHTIFKNSPRIIGWNDEDFRKIVDEAKEQRRKERLEQEQRRQIKLQDGDGNTNANGTKVCREEKEVETDFSSEIEGFGSGLMEIITNSLLDAMWKQQQKQLHSGDDDDALQQQKKGLIQEEEEKQKEEYKRETKKTFLSGDVIARDTKVYNSILETLRYQRDAYIMGATFGEKQKSQREKEQQQNPNEEKSQGLESKRIKKQGSSKLSTVESSQPFETLLQQYASDPTHDCYSSLGNIQIQQLAQNFIVSPTMYNLLRPTVLYTLAPPQIYPHNLPEGGPLHRIIKRAVVDVIPMSQPLVDRTMKNSILWFLKNEHWRNWVKKTASSSGGISYSSVTQRDDDE